MHYITNTRITIPKDKRLVNLRKDLFEFLQVFKMAYGGIKLKFYKSKVPFTILSHAKRGPEVKREQANHIVVKWDKITLMEFFLCSSKIFGFRVKGYFYDKSINIISPEEVKNIISMLDRYNFKTYKLSFLDYGLIPWIIALIIIGILAWHAIVK